MCVKKYKYKTISSWYCDITSFTEFNKLLKPPYIHYQKPSRFHNVFIDVKNFVGNVYKLYNSIIDNKHINPQFNIRWINDFVAQQFVCKIRHRSTIRFLTLLRFRNMVPRSIVENIVFQILHIFLWY